MNKIVWNWFLIIFAILTASHFGGGLAMSYTDGVTDTMCKISYSCESVYLFEFGGYTLSLGVFLSNVIAGFCFVIVNFIFWIKLNNYNLLKKESVGGFL